MLTIEMAYVQRAEFLRRKVCIQIVPFTILFQDELTIRFNALRAQRPGYPEKLYNFQVGILNLSWTCLQKAFVYFYVLLWRVLIER